MALLLRNTLHCIPSIHDFLLAAVSFKDFLVKEAELSRFRGDFIENNRALGLIEHIYESQVDLLFKLYPSHFRLALRQHLLLLQGGLINECFNLRSNLRSQRCELMPCLLVRLLPYNACSFYLLLNSCPALGNLLSETISLIQDFTLDLSEMLLTFLLSRADPLQLMAVISLNLL